MNERVLNPHNEEKLKRIQKLLDKNTKEMLSLNKRHVGETIYIIGASPQLNELTKEQINQLNQSVTIGLNRTQFLIDLKYFISAYVFESEMAKRCRRNCFTIHARAVYHPPLLPFINTIKRGYYCEEFGLPPILKEPIPTIYTYKNIALGATHLALILGAKRIVYIGIQKKNYLHFYQTNEQLKRIMENCLKNLHSKNIMSIDHPGKSVPQQLSNLYKDPEIVKNTPDQFEDLVREKFTHYFDNLNHHNVEYFSTASESVLCDAGAPYVPLEELLPH